MSTTGLTLKLIEVITFRREVHVSVYRRGGVNYSLKSRCQAEHDCSLPGYPSNRLLIIANLLLNCFACVHRIR